MDFRFIKEVGVVHRERKLFGQVDIVLILTSAKSPDSNSYYILLFVFLLFNLFFIFL